MRVVNTCGYVFVVLISLLSLSGCTGAREHRSAQSAASLATARAIQKIAFGSCAYQFESQPYWDVIARTDPDLFIFAGDAIYADWNGTQHIVPSATSLRAAWQQLADRPHFKKFRAAVPVIAVWDNHDYGTADGGREFPLKQQSKDAFLDFLNEPEGTTRRRRDGVFESYFVGVPGKRTQIILLDTRSFRQPPPVDSRSADEKEKLGIVGRYQPDTSGRLELLGEAQWRWLTAELQRPAAVRIIVSGTQVIANEKRMDEWGNYPHERERLLKLVADTHDSVPLILSGNIHFAELSRARVGGRCLTELTSSGLTHVALPPAVGNRFRLGSPVAEENFGLVTIEHTERGAVVELAVYDIGGTRLRSYLVDSANANCKLPAGGVVNAF